MLRVSRYAESAVLRFATVVMLVLLTAFVAQAQQSLHQDYSRLIRAQHTTSPVGVGGFGERVDYFTGNVAFVFTDVEIPGNNTLRVAVSRRYLVENRNGATAEVRAFGDWELEVPRIEGIVSGQDGWIVDDPESNKRCSKFAAPPSVVVENKEDTEKTDTTFTAAQFHAGYQMIIPGQGRRELLKRDVNNTQKPAGVQAYPVVTADWWALRCIATLSAPATGEGFIALAPDGTSYRFDHLVGRPTSSLWRRADTTTPNVTASLDRQRVQLFVTRVEDRFGNYVNYRYDTVHRERLTDIESSDGRDIHINYTGSPGRVSSISDGTRSFSYSYTSGRLTGVQLPDSTSWSINFSALTNDAGWSYATANCSSLSNASDSSLRTVSITHPAGATASFKLRPVRRGRSGSPAGCITNSGGELLAQVQPAVYDTFALVEKRVSGAELGGDLVWSVAYGGCTTSSCTSTVTTTVTDPEGADTRYTFNAAFGGNEGELTRIDSGGSGGGSFLKSETWSYQSTSGQSFPATSGAPTQVRGDAAFIGRIHPVQSQSIEVQGKTFTRSSSSFNSFGFPTSVTRSNGSYTKSESHTYVDRLGPWVIGIPSRVTSGGKTEIDRTINSNGLVTRVERFGLLHRLYGYYGEGYLASEEDGGGNRTVYSNYLRGIPRHIEFDDGRDEEVTVSNSGTVLSWTDANNYTWTFVRDAFGRLERVSAPSNEGDDTVFSLNKSSSGWILTEAKGSRRVITKFDTLLRPILTRSGSSSSTTRYVTREFDGNGNLTFQSYPSSASSSVGTDYFYDRLNRLTRAVQEGGSETNYDYLGDFETRITDGDGDSVTIAYQAFDEPVHNWPVRFQTEIHTTTVSRDDWGKPLSSTRSGVARKWYYGSGERLCGAFNPETGTEVYAYDGAGNIAWTSRRDVDTVGCNSAAVPVNERTVRSYDSTNRLTGINFPDATPDISYTWTPDNLIESASTTAGVAGVISRAFTYNKRRLLTADVLTIGGRAFEMARDYNSRGDVQSDSYPANGYFAFPLAPFVVDYAPNVFGEPTQVGNFVTNVTYHPTGDVMSFVYGNGVQHTTSLDSLKRTQRMTDSGVLDVQYSYDDAGRVSGITDLLTGQRSMTVGYDDNGRMTSANAPNAWGASSYSYNDSDSLTSISLGGMTTTFAHATRNRLTSVTNASGTRQITYDLRGNITGKGSDTFAYSSTDQMVVRDGVPSSYDAFGLRVNTGSPAMGNTDFVFSAGGRLMHEFFNCPPPPPPPVPPPPVPIPTPDCFPLPAQHFYLGNKVVASRYANFNAEPPTVRYLHSDASGNVVAQSNSIGDAEYTPIFTPYGANWPLISTPLEFGFAGHISDRGLVYMRARHYDPELGRFLSADPVAFDPRTGGSWTRYGYGLNSPLNWLDPSGRDESWFSEVDMMGNPLGGNPVGGAGITASVLAVGAVASAPSVVAAVGSGIAGSIGFTGAVTQLGIRGALIAYTPEIVTLGALGSEALLAASGAAAPTSPASMVLDVGSNSVRASRESLEALADLALEGGKSSGAAAQLKVGEKVYFGVSGDSIEHADEMLGVLMGAPSSIKPPIWHGACAEIICVNKALQDGVDPSGGLMRVVNVGSTFDGQVHGANKDFCPSCDYVLRYFGVTKWD